MEQDYFKRNPKANAPSGSRTEISGERLQESANIMMLFNTINNAKRKVDRMKPEEKKAAVLSGLSRDASEEAVFISTLIMRDDRRIFEDVRHAYSDQKTGAYFDESNRFNYIGPKDVLQLQAKQRAIAEFDEKFRETGMIDKNVSRIALHQDESARIPSFDEYANAPDFNEYANAPKVEEYANAPQHDKYAQSGPMLNPLLPPARRLPMPPSNDRSKDAKTEIGNAEQKPANLGNAEQKPANLGNGQQKPANFGNAQQKPANFGNAQQKPANFGPAHQKMPSPDTMQPEVKAPSRPPRTLVLAEGANKDIASDLKLPAQPTGRVSPGTKFEPQPLQPTQSKLETSIAPKLQAVSANPSRFARSGPLADLAQVVNSIEFKPKLATAPKPIVGNSILAQSAQHADTTQQQGAIRPIQTPAISPAKPGPLHHIK